MAGSNTKSKAQSEKGFPGFTDFMFPDLRGVEAQIEGDRLVLLRSGRRGQLSATYDLRDVAGVEVCHKRRVTLGFRAFRWVCFTILCFLSLRPLIYAFIGVFATSEMWSELGSCVAQHASATLPLLQCIVGGDIASTFYLSGWCLAMLYLLSGELRTAGEGCESCVVLTLLKQYPRHYQIWFAQNSDALRWAANLDAARSALSPTPPVYPSPGHPPFIARPQPNGVEQASAQ